MLQQVAKRLRRPDAKLDTHARLRHDGHARRSPREHVGHDRMGCERVQKALGIVGARSQVDVVNGLGAAPKPARHRQRRGPGRFDEVGDDPLRDGERSADRYPLVDRCAGSQRRKLLDHLGDDRWADSHNPRQAPVGRDRGQGVQIGHAEGVPHGASTFGPESLQMRDRCETLGDLGAQALERGDLAGRGEFDDLVLQGLADVGQIDGAPSQGQFRHRLTGSPDPRGAPAVGQDPMAGLLTGDLEQVADQIEPIRDLAVGGEGLRAHTRRVLSRRRSGGVDGVACARVGL